MAQCLNKDGTNACYFADYNEVTGQHVLREEVDIFGNAIGGEAHRVMRMCGQKQDYWLATAYDEHRCPKFADYAERHAAEQDTKRANTRKRLAHFGYTTQRSGLPEKATVFDYLSICAEDSKVAYEFYVNIFEALGDKPAEVLEIFGKLDDMNIRGRQVDTIIEYCFGGDVNNVRGDKLASFRKRLSEDAATVARHVNKHFDKSNIEVAVPSGATILR